MKTLKTTYFILSGVFLAWLFLSWLDVIAHNTTPGGVLSEYNAIVLIFENMNNLLKGCIF